MMQSAGRGLSAHDLKSASASFDALSRETAWRVIKFYEMRSKSGDPPSAKDAVQASDVDLPRQAM
jgi:hypothetical protein